MRILCDRCKSESTEFDRRRDWDHIEVSKQGKGLLLDIYLCPKCSDDFYKFLDSGSNVECVSSTNDDKKKYQINLFYGYEEGECGIYHAFEAADPDAEINEDAMEKRLAEMLQVEPQDDSFNWNSMYIALPDSVVERIKNDAISQFKNDTIRQFQNNIK